jgi:hypothetical protein
MLYVSSSLTKYFEFRKKFEEMHGTNFLSLSKVSCDTLIEECESVFQHHSDASIFLGYLEPGWMLSSAEQTRMRKIIRKFSVAMVCHFPESIPYSWKNEIDIFYTDHPLNQNGNSNSINNGGALQDKSDSGHNDVSKHDSTE